MASRMTLTKDDPSVNSVIKAYWFKYKKIEVILAYLRSVHRMSVGLTWLKKRLNTLGLFRKGPKVKYSPVAQVQSAIEAELQGCCNNIGYRQMWAVLRQKYLLTVRRSTVQMLMSILDHDGAKRRRKHRLKRRVYQNKGPDFVWHLDGYDKLKPYGFAIHGCIDGYSRKIIWLELLNTNNDPGVIVLPYLIAVLSNEGCPSVVRSDHGTENTILAATHMSLRHGHVDDFKGERSYRFGSSTTNTRIESWWAQLRNSVTDWWINTFKDLVQEGVFNPHNEIQRHCLAYTYELLLREALDSFCSRWNSHKIRPSRTAGCPSGVPEDLYKLPHLNGTRSFKQAINFEIWAYSYLEFAKKADTFFPEEFGQAADAILAELGMIRHDITTDSARAIYLYLCEILQ